MPPQTTEQKLDVLGSFATAARIRSVWGTKLFVDRATGDMQLQESGFRTFWNRTAADSLTNPQVHNQVTAVFVRAISEHKEDMQQQRISHVQQGNYGISVQPDLAHIARILYAFKGYSTLIKMGYSGVRALRDHVGKIAEEINQNLIPISARNAFNQGKYTKEGFCFGFTLDWLRRAYKQKFAYDYLNDDEQRLKIQSKIDAVAAISDGPNQRRILNAGRDPFGATLAVYAGAVPMVNNRLSTRAYEAPFARRFQGMTLHQTRPFFIAPEDQRCFQVGPVGAPLRPPQVCSEIIQYLSDDKGRVAVCGWLLGLNFRDFFSDARTDGHAIGIVFEGNHTAHCFDPNYGSEQFYRAGAAGWLAAIIKNYSLTYAVWRIDINRVSRAAP